MTGLAKYIGTVNIMMYTMVTASILFMKRCTLINMS